MPSLSSRKDRKMRIKWVLVPALIIGLSTAAVLQLRSRDASAEAKVAQGQIATVLLDFSLSFAPYSDTDRRAVDRIRAAIEDLTLHSWEPPVTTIWYGIGTQSLFAPPLCAPGPFTPGMTTGRQA